MKFIIKVRKYSLLHSCLILILAAIPIISSAQNIVDTSSPQDPLVAPTIVVRPSTVEPDCHNYTGCDVIVVKKHPTYHYYKSNRHYVYHRHC